MCEYMFPHQTGWLGTPALFHSRCAVLWDEPFSLCSPVLAICFAKGVIVLPWGPSFPQGACGVAVLPHLFSLPSIL